MCALGLQISAVDVLQCLNPVFPCGTPSMALGDIALESDLLFLQLICHSLSISPGSWLFHSALSDFLMDF